VIGIAWRGEMGRYGGKATTSDFLRLDVRYLQRKGFLGPGRFATLRWSRNGEPFASMGLRADFSCVVLTYRHRRYDEEWKDEEYPVRLEWTPCNYGGSRPWFRCPAMGCGRRIAVLYGSGIFACRQCHRLAYESQREPAYSRALSRMQAIREKLGGSGSMIEDFPSKPRGMHWRTYSRVMQLYEYAQSHSWPF